MRSQRPTQNGASDALIPALILFGGLTLLLIGLLATRRTAAPAPNKMAVASPTSVVASVAETTEAPQNVAMALDPAKVKAGESSFQTTCAACHGFNAMGIPGLGKPLIGSKFVNGLTDDELLAFLQVGRPVTDPLNTTGVQMPPRGGNPSLTDDKLSEVIDYIRSLNASPISSGSSDATATLAPTSSTPAATEVPYTFTPLDLSGLAVPTSISGASTATPSAEVTAGATTNAMSAVSRASLYAQSCAGCHGADGSGVNGIAKPLSESALLQAKNGIGLLNFLINGHAGLNPPHPNRGGNPQLSDEDLLSIIGYLYSLTAGK